jgi:hypothetical protein
MLAILLDASLGHRGRGSSNPPPPGKIVVLSEFLVVDLFGLWPKEQSPCHGFSGIAWNADPLRAAAV